jgi:hypothetical protein
MQGTTRLMICQLTRRGPPAVPSPFPSGSLFAPTIPDTSPGRQSDPQKDPDFRKIERFLVVGDIIHNFLPYRAKQACYDTSVLNIYKINSSCIANEELRYE